METTNLKMSLGATGLGTTLTVALDDQVIWSGDPGTKQVQISHDLLNDEKDHVMTIELSGKTEQHTIVDEQGEIAQDLLVKIHDIFLDDVDISQLVWAKSQYRHDFNGSQPEILDQFFGDMGCNGKIEFQFSTPAYLWILENS
jgi:hypothetical protein